ncbi:hypothetical protein FZC79_18470 [Rossellomorea vietnamensis]|uniref:Uncharacterized protein n=1 Tax=Rossellomorea vietnamensis TaxID=218284 RepID=A0A5D4K986_9BACI|nr:hypothetical protein [Rossellomorea vietnamensis]TYR73429.1 hypothetical protein FZC79_18470 [Rossellomorea vietnamensis]
MIWMNSDKATKKCKVHTQIAYTYIKKETDLKRVGKLKRDGGWLPFENHQETWHLQQMEFPSYKLNDCPCR